MTIGDTVDDVKDLLGNRSDITARISRWIASGYRDIATTIPFETLEQTDNTFLVPNVDTYDYLQGARAVKSITLGFPAGVPQSWRPLRKRNVKILDRYNTSTPGTPSIWAPFNQQYIIRNVPDNAYQLIVRYWMSVQIDPNDINNTVIQVPDDWVEIVTYQAAMRGFMALLEPDKAAAIRTLLYGNPKQPDKPGLLKQRLTRIQAESMDADYGLRPKLNRYTFTW
jgi:hypothetical protein